MSKSEDIFYDLGETLSDFDLILEGFPENAGERNNFLAQLNNRLHVYLDNWNCIAYGEIISRKYSQKLLLRKLSEIRQEAINEQIPYCFIEASDECFICETDKDIRTIRFVKDYPEFQAMKYAYEKDNINVTPQQFRHEFQLLIKSYRRSLGNSCAARLEKLQLSDEDIRITSESISLTSKKEDELFRALLGERKEEYVYRYISSSSLYRILSEKKASMCSVVGMNDNTESTYADKKCEINKERFYPNDLSGNWMQEFANSVFISSCVPMERADDLTMWRLYGENGKGVCIRYKIDSELSKTFYIAPISYARDQFSHPELDFILDLTGLNFGGIHFHFSRFFIWKHFFKPYEYSVEKEVRLLCVSDYRKAEKWIRTGDSIYCPIIEFPIVRDNNQFPLIIDSIILGPNFMHSDTNRRQILFRLTSSDILYIHSPYLVECSEIESYR